jgi:branched-chain amino acid transport system ATP-binding protein
MALLAVANLSKSFGAVKVADDFNLSLEEGETIGIIGPNGAGKSSLFNLISGNLRPQHGRVFFSGKDITRSTPQQRCRAGIGRTYQIPQPFAKMTVLENCVVAAAFGTGHSERRSYGQCASVLERIGLLRKANVPAGSLTLLERKKLELARVLSSSPKLLLLDEIAGGLTEQEAFELIAMIKEISARGTTIIWIEHIVHALVATVSRLIVIDFGCKVMDGEPSAVINSAEVRRIYMGIDVE